MPEQTSLKIDELNQFYEDSKDVDKEAVAEMRSNILLTAGEHYSKKLQDFIQQNRTRTNGQTNDGPKLRITKNWTHRAHRIYVSSILSQSPNTKISPKNPMELSDQKDAELNESVWQHLQEQTKFTEGRRNFVSDFCGVGECVAKVFFDPNRGYLKGYEGAMDENGQPEMNDDNSQAPDKKKPVFSGEFVIERIYAHQLFRHASAKQMSDSAFFGIEKMEKTKILKQRYSADPKKIAMLGDAPEEFVVFDTNKNGYTKQKDMTLIREFYFKSSPEYPLGYFYITTKTGILEEGELPAGVYPILWKGFDEHPTKARATSMVKVARPWQAEINRASSQCALAQITLGDDKILYQAGTQLSQGAQLPGVRGMKYTGAPPTILAGRAGDQYYEYIGQQQQEMDKALMLDLLDQEKAGQMDPYTLLFRSMNQSQYFSFYSDKFGEFLVDITKTVLELAKFYLPDDEVIAAVGKAEVINLVEFRKTTPLCHRIHVEEMSDTVESQLGHQLTMNHLLQYAGPQLTREDIGRLMQNSPFGNWKEQFSDFTIDERNVKNDFLAMERGQMPPISPADNSEYILKRVSTRKKERDFGLLQPQVQNLYSQYEQFHLNKQAKEAEATKQAESEFIPVGGAMIACDMYVPGEDAKKAPKRVRVPYQALDWMLKTLDQQGMSQGALESLNGEQMMAASKQLTQNGQPPSGPSMQPTGQDRSMGVMQ